MIVINGKSYSGRSVSISGNKVIIDGNDVTPDAKSIKIDVEGNIDSLNVDYSDFIRIKGDCGDVQSQVGDINISGDVKGSVSTMSGDVDVRGNILGNIKTMSGDINN